MNEPDQFPNADTPPPVRRDFLVLLTTATAAAGAGAFVWPFLQSLGRGEDASDLDTAVEVDLKPLLPGQQVVVVWRGMPVFVVRRTAAALAALQDASLAARLRDPRSVEQQQPPYAVNWHRSAVPEYGVMVGVCTHLGCVPRYRPVADGGRTLAGAITRPAPGGYVCPCHGSRFDLAGRVLFGAPAQYNLPVPPYSFSQPDRLRIGIGPDGSVFDFNDIAKI